MASRRRRAGRGRRTWLVGQARVRRSGRSTRSTPGGCFPPITCAAFVIGPATPADDFHPNLHLYLVQPSGCVLVRTRRALKRVFELGFQGFATPQLVGDTPALFCLRVSASWPQATCLRGRVHHDVNSRCAPLNAWLHGV